jgi:ribosome-associated protein
MIEITPQLSIDDSELTFTASRSGGPGGQNVNKVNSKVTVTFDVRSSPSLSDEQKQRIEEKLATRMTNEGVLLVSSQKFRTQPANKDAAVARLVELLQEALYEKPKRKKTRVSKAAKEKRLQEKKQAAQKKKLRTEKF